MDRAVVERPLVKPAVGLIGLGQMGSGIARNLDAAGLLTAAFDVRPGAFAACGFSERVAELAPGAMAADCDIVFFVVSTSQQIAACLDGPAGMLAQPRPGQIIVDLTTADPEDTKALAERALAAGRAYVDAAMTGGAVGADAGTLTLMVGGDDAAFAELKPVLETVASQLFHLGPVGSGHAMKLVHNMILHSGFLATCEGCLVAERAGLDLEAVVAVLNAGNARSFVTEVRFPRHIVSGTFDARSRVSNLAKDVAMAVRFAGRLSQPVEIGSLASNLLRRAEDAGFADEDFSRLYLHLADLEKAHQREEAPA